MRAFGTDRIPIKVIGKTALFDTEEGARRSPVGHAHVLCEKIRCVRRLMYDKILSLADLSNK